MATNEMIEPLHGKRQFSTSNSVRYSWFLEVELREARAFYRKWRMDPFGFERAYPKLWAAFLDWCSKERAPPGMQGSKAWMDLWWEEWVFDYAFHDISKPYDSPKG